MLGTVEIPIWLLTLILLFAAVTFASHFLFPSVRWFLRRRAQKIVDRLNTRLARPIEPFKLSRRVDTIQRLTYDPQVMRAVQDYARSERVREDVAFEMARRYAREIVPGFSASLYFGFATRAAKWLATRLFTVKIGNRERASLSDISKDATLVYVMNHRSNMDYVLVTYLVAQQSALAYAVGEWARIWPLAPLIRSLGGYFIRRRSRNALYRRVLARYVQLATDGGVTQAVFPEGGLSQTGQLQAPKLGVLSYLIDGHDPEEQDIVFVPVALNYDRIIEDRILIEAREKGEKRFRGTVPSATAFSLRYIGRRIMRRAQRFGMAAVSFGEPLSLRDWPGPQAADVLAAELMRRIRQVMPVMSVPLVAWIIRNADDPMSDDDILEAANAHVAELREAGATVLVDAPDAVERGLFHLRLRKIVSGGETAAVLPGQDGLIAFYAASHDEIVSTHAKPAEAVENQRAAAT